MQLIPFSLKLIALAAVSALTAGCVMTMPTKVEAPTDLTSATATVDSSELDVAAGFDADQLFVLRPLESGSQDLPAGIKPVRNLSVTARTVGDALTLLASAANLQLVFEDAAVVSGPALKNVSGSFADVMQTLATAYGLNWEVEGRKLVVARETQFVLQLPPMLQAESLTGMVTTLKQLGARDVSLNADDRAVVLRADGNVRKKVVAYLDHVRANRSMIVYDIDVWQVNLSAEQSQGIDWSKLSWTYSSGALSGVNAIPNGAAGVSMSFNGSKVTVNMLANWLQTQGAVKSISRPRLAIMSGSKGTFAVGQTTTYVAKVGSTQSNDTTVNTMEVGSLSTGLELSVSGDVQDNTVLSKVSVNLSDLLGMKTYKTGDSELSLPQTATRKLETAIRARPGDTVLLGGITSGTDNTEKSRSLVAAGSRDSATRSELVIAIRPRIVKFLGKAAVAATPAAESTGTVAVAQK